MQRCLFFNLRSYHRNCFKYDAYNIMSMSLSFWNCVVSCNAVNTHCGSDALIIAVLTATCPQFCVSCSNNSVGHNVDEGDSLNVNEW